MYLIYDQRINCSILKGQGDLVVLGLDHRTGSHSNASASAEQSLSVVILILSVKVLCGYQCLFIGCEIIIQL